jgi:hypothetical protein
MPCAAIASTNPDRMTIRNLAVERRSARNAAAVCAALALQGSCASAPPVGGYRTIRIDASTLKVDLQNPIVLEFDRDRRARPILGSYYQLFIGQGGGRSIEHYFQKDAATPRIRYLHLETGADHILGRTTSRRELLRGQFGTVYSTKECFFNSPVENYPSSIDVRLYGNLSEHEPPTVASEKPGWAGSAITNVSVIRVFRGGPEYLVATATYSPSGRLTAASVQGSRDGDWVHPAYVEEARQGAVTIGPDGPTAGELATLSRYGLPATVSIENAAAHQPVGLRAVSNNPPERDVVNVHYDYDRWIAQDDYPAGLPHQTRYLTYAQTPENAGLDPLCAARFPAKLRASQHGWKSGTGDKRNRGGKA